MEIYYCPLKENTISNI